jgi:hypothetical protein
MFEAVPWGIVVIAGPLALALALGWALRRNARRDRTEDPRTPADDPSKGLPGHDVSDGTPPQLKR